MRTRKIVVTLLLLALLLVCLSLQVFATEVEIYASSDRTGYAKWVITTDHTLTYYADPTMNGENYSESPFDEYADYIEKIVVKDVRSLGDNVFSGLYNVKTVELDSSVVKIGNGAFAGLKSLKSITIPKSVTTLGGSTFYLCTNLQEVIFEEGSTLKEIPGAAFAGCALKTISLPDTVTTIGKDAFYGCEQLESVKWPANLQILNFGAFENCTSLTGHLYLPQSVTTVESTAFKNIKGFETAEIYTAVQYIKFNNENLRSVKYGGDVVFLMNHEGAAKLEEVIIDAPIKTMHHSTFENCVSLKSITLPESLTELGSDCFMGSGLTSIHLPSRIRELPSSAFEDCKDLKSVTWGEHLTEIGYDVFRGCSSLVSIDLEGLTVIDTRAFKECTSLKKVTLPETLERLGWEVFAGCTALEEVTIAADGLEFGQAVFSECTGLETIRFLGDAPYFYYTTDLEFKNVKATVYYPLENRTWSKLIMHNYGGELTWVARCENHPYTTIHAEADCIHPGTITRSCSVCGDVQVEPDGVPPKGHDYGLDEDGNPDFWDTTCDVCGAERVVDKHRPTHSMYRMYNPNSGEHFYTGSMKERKNLEAAGWKYEGVGFTFPATTGKPVYRLYDRDNTKEHLYTMDEAEKDQLLAEGWILEGVAFNSGNEDEVPQYRLHNPNATIGAYHFTASIEEKDDLIAAGWEYQGIGFYTCWQ